MKKHIVVMVFTFVPNWLKQIACLGTHWVLSSFTFINPRLYISNLLNLHKGVWCNGVIDLSSSY